MKISCITPSYFPAIKFGGPIQSVHLLNKALVKKGLKVDVLTTNAGNSKQSMGEWMNGCMKDDSWCHFDNIRVKYLSFVGYEHYNFSFQMVKEIWKIIDDYDLVHITAVWNFPVLAGALISSIKKKPYIISPRGEIYKETIELKSNSFKKLYFNVFAKHYFNKASAIHFTTEDEKEKVTSYLKLKAPSFVIPNGIDLREIEYGERRLAKSIKADYVLILGRIDRKKGFDILIPAFAKVAAKFNDLKLVIAGNTKTSYYHSIIQSIQKYGINEKVIFTGEVTDGDKWSLYKNVLMFVLPSYSENFGMSVVEAMACGCPVVILEKVGIYKEVAHNEAGIIVKTKVQSVEEGILKLLLNDENLRKKIAANGKAMVKKYYDIDKIAEQMSEQYRLVINNQ